MNPKHIVIVCGEKSGDLLGAHCMKSIGLEHSYSGICGSEMISNGAHSILPMTTLSVMGYQAVLSSLFKIKKAENTIINHINTVEPDLIILIDLPGFNLRIAKKLKIQNKSHKILYYVCPSIWIWKSHRKKTLENYVDYLLTLFDFEKKLFKDSVLPVECTGHPLLSQPNGNETKEYLTLFPGSRKQEIVRNFPIQYAAAKKLSTYTGLPIAVSIASPELLPLITSIVDGHCILEEGTSILLHKTKFAIATSGTMTLQLASMAIPTVVTYSITGMDYFIAKFLLRLKIEYISLPNIILGKMLFPEIVSTRLSCDQIFSTSKTLLEQDLSYNFKKLSEILNQHNNTNTIQTAFKALINSNQQDTK